MCCFLLFAYAVQQEIREAAPAMGLTNAENSEYSHEYSLFSAYMHEIFIACERSCCQTAQKGENIGIYNGNSA